MVVHRVGRVVEGRPPAMGVELGLAAEQFASGVLIIIGLWFAEDIWVKAPQRIPLS